MRIGETTTAASPELRTAVAASIAHARSIDPDELQRRIAEQNQPSRVSALYGRLAQYRRNRLAAEAQH